MIQNRLYSTKIFKVFIGESYSTTPLVWDLLDCFRLIHTRNMILRMAHNMHGDTTNHDQNMCCLDFSGYTYVFSSSYIMTIGDTIHMLNSCFLDPI
jgi:hypothetical protein